MQQSDLCRLLPTAEMLAEAFPDCEAFIFDATACYQSIQFFHKTTVPDDKTIYLLSRQYSACFPVDSHSYISAEAIPGRANHIYCPGLEEGEILDRTLALFAALREQEISLDQLVYQNVGLSELCEAGAKMLENPVYLHDDWFITLAMSSQAGEHMRPEYIMSSASGFVPQAILDDFKYDNEYLETYTHHTPQIWHSTSQGPRSLYVNLWEGDIYRGRLLIFETNRPFLKKDFLVAQLLAQHAMQLLRQRHPGGGHTRSMDDLVYLLLQGQQPDTVELIQMLHSLNWNADEQFIVIQVQSQQEISSAMEHLLHTDLFRSFSNCYILLNGHQQCLILNLSRQRTTLSALRHTLAPLCRDYCLYAGISSPVLGIRDIHAAYVQSGIALNEAFRLRNEKWIIPFSDCALDYWFEHLSGVLKTQHLASPELRYLIQYDQENGTEYFETIREYLLQERNIPRTSEKLIIHRTTLLYRLKKIQALVPLNLEDPKTRLYLLLSLQILQSTK